MSIMAKTGWTSPDWEKPRLGPTGLNGGCKEITDHSPPVSLEPNYDSSQTHSWDSKDQPTVVPKDDKVSVSEQVVLAMGFSQTIVQMAKVYHFMQHGSNNVPDAGTLFEAAEFLTNSPEKQKEMGRVLHEQALKAEQEVASKKIVMGNKESPSSVPPPPEKLEDKVKRLALENHKLRQRKICFQCKKVNLTTSGVTFLPCGHFITCETCAEKFDNCPACNKTVMGTVRTYLS